MVIPNELNSCVLSDTERMPVSAFICVSGTIPFFCEPRFVRCWCEMLHVACRFHSEEEFLVISINEHVAKAKQKGKTYTPATAAFATTTTTNTTMSMYSYCSATLTEVFPCFFLSCKANNSPRRGPHSSKIFVSFYYCLFCVVLCIVYV